MRQIGSLEREAEARTLQSYLLTQNVRAMVELEDGHWVVWIYDEDQLEQARRELDAFRQAPDDPRYKAAVNEAVRIEKVKQKEARRLQKKQVDMREQWARRGLGRTPVTSALIILSVAVTVMMTSFSGQGESGFLGPMLCNRPAAGYLMISTSPGTSLPEVRQGQVWRLVTPVFLHFSLLHILFNMLWTRDLGSVIEAHVGSLKFLGIVLFCAVVSNLGQYVVNGPHFGGMSGVGFGFFGYIYIKSRVDPGSGLYMSQNLAMLGFLWLFLGFAGVIGHMANYAHLFGMMAGGLLAYLSSRRQRRKR